MIMRAERQPGKKNEALLYPGLRNQPDRSEKQGALTDRAKLFLRAQFGRPSGLFGCFVGAIMARTPSNLDRIQWTLSLLKVTPHDRILEIGFGPGVAISLLSRIVSDGLVVGVDHSEVMVRQARRRNALAIRNGRVVVQLGSASRPPDFDEPFDKVFTINSIHFWHEPVECLKKLRVLMRPGGLIAVVIQPRSRRATDATAEAIGGEVLANLTHAGFSSCRLEIRPSKPVATACALGVANS